MSTPEARPIAASLGAADAWRRWLRSAECAETDSEQKRYGRPVLSTIAGTCCPPPVTVPRLVMIAQAHKRRRCQDPCRSQRPPGPARVNVISEGRP